MPKNSRSRSGRNTAMPYQSTERTSTFTKDIHFERAELQLGLIHAREGIEEDLIMRAGYAYLFYRKTVTEEHANAMDVVNLSEAARCLVIQELVDLEQREATYPEVMRGVQLGRLALRETTTEIRLNSTSGY